MVKENGMVMMTDEEFKRVCTCYEKNLTDQKQEHDEIFNMVCKEYEREITTLKKEMEEAKEEYEKRLALMQKALMELTKEVDTVPNGKRVSKADFLAMHSAAVRDMDDDFENNDIYGYDFIVYWHGIYCNCGDGATPANCLVPGIEECLEEDPTEY